MTARKMKQLLVLCMFTALALASASSASATVTYTGPAGWELGTWFIGRGDVISYAGKPALVPQPTVTLDFTQTKTFICTYADGTVLPVSGSVDYGMVYQAQPRYAPGNNTITGYIAGIAQGHPWSGTTFMYELAHCPTANDAPEWVAAHGALTESTVAITRTLTLYFEGVVVYGPLLVYGPVAG
jgi:hypothetical protein